MMPLVRQEKGTWPAKSSYHNYFIKITFEHWPNLE